mgnify:CR=1 FL=1
MSTAFRNKLVLLFFIVFAVVVTTLYRNTFSSPFVFDDRPTIVENEKIRNIKSFSEWSTIKKQRPLVDFTFALNYNFGGLEVSGYHAVNIFIHIINGLLVFLLVFLILSSVSNGLQHLSNSEESTQHYSFKHKYFIAIITALLFTVHPLQTQAVAYIAQRYTSMAAMFFLAAIILYILARQQQRAQNAKRPSHSDGSRATTLEGSCHRPVVTTGSLFLLSFICGVAAFLSKQNAATLPLVILMLEYLLFDRSLSGWRTKSLWLLPICGLFVLFVLYSSGVTTTGMR